MKKIKVTLQREVEIEILIDETIINKEALDAVSSHFDNDIYKQPESCEGELSEYECGLYNYARSAAIVTAGFGEVEYITLDNGHTIAKVESDYLESAFEKMETI